ncbi:MAG TPA: endonuclease/exonuclease/phosphatase family protein [Usitatibacter sp.]|nr:endonuclease/exonuclease/phosphatase family protein [Usitatibacter sp.]
MPALRVVSYNVHRAIGRDRRTAPQRILDVLREIDADIVALQEVEARDGGADMLAWLGEQTGFAAIPGTTLVRHDGHYGNGILTRYPVASIAHCDLSWRGREPRAAIAADLRLNGEILRFVATHLGLRPAERRDQVTRLLKLFTDRPYGKAILVGDLNEWFLWGRPLRRLHRYFESTPAVASFPSGMPFLALDRIWTHPRSMLRSLTVHRTPLARVASDHLPLVATLEVGASAAQAHRKHGAHAGAERAHANGG